MVLDLMIPVQCRSLFLQGPHGVCLARSLPGACTGSLALGGISGGSGGSGGMRQWACTS